MKESVFGTFKMHEIASRADLCELAISELSAKNDEINKQKKLLTDEQKNITSQGEYFESCLERLRAADPNYDATGVRAYLERQAQARAERAERAKAFINAGTTIKDVQAQLETKAPVDKKKK